MFELRIIGIVRRASAWLLDVILLAVLTTGFMFLISLICNFDGEQALAIEYDNEWNDYRKEYIADVAEYYGFLYEVSEDGTTYTVTKDGAHATLNAVIDMLISDKNRDARMTEAFEAYEQLPPAEVTSNQYRYVLSLLFMMLSVGLLLAYLILEFMIPLFLKNGQTVGKKVFGICVVRQNCVKIAPILLFARTILGKFTVETMFPVLLAFLYIFGGMNPILAIILFVAIFLLNGILFFATKNRTPIHDLFAGTVAADMRLQMIFESEEELIEKKKAQHKEFIENSKS